MNLASLAQALAIGYEDGAPLPEDIQWMPPGRHEVTPLVNGKRVRRTNVADPTVAAMVDGVIQRMRASAASGKGDLPYIDFNHEDGAASAEVLGAFWGGDHPQTGGIRIKVAWSSAGADAIKGKTFRRFSPNWFLHPTDPKPVGVPVNLGGLVNRAAFEQIQAVAKGGETKTHMTEEEKTELAQVIASATAPLVKRLESLEGQLASAKADTTAVDPKVASLEARLAAIEGTNRTAALASAKAKVDMHVAAGRLAPQDATSQDFWVQTIAANPAAEIHLAKMPANPALGSVTSASASGSAVAGQPSPETAEGFVATYKTELASAKDSSKAIDAAIGKNSKGYSAWLAAGGKPGLA